MSSSGSMLPPERTTATGGSNGARVVQQRGDRRRPGRLDDELGPLEAEQQRAGQRLLGHRDDLVDELAHEGERHRPGQPTAMPSAIVAIPSSATGCPAASDAGKAAALSACTPTTRTSGRIDLTASAMPASSPPPPVQTTTVRTSGTCSRISSPTVPWPGDDVRVVERVDQHRAGLLGEAVSPPCSASSTEVPVEPHLRAVRLGGLHLGDRRALGHEHGGADAEQGRGERDPLRVVAGAGGDDAAGRLVRRTAARSGCRRRGS